MSPRSDRRRLDEWRRDSLDGLHLTDPWIAAITPERIASSLHGFSLPLAKGWHIPRLTRAIQDIANSARGEAPQSNTDAKAELTRLADKARALANSIKNLGETAEVAAFWQVYRRETEADEAVSIDDVLYRNVLLDPLINIANVLSKAASHVETKPTQPPRWREKEAQERRVGFAVNLMPVFDQAFATKAKANNWLAEYGEEQPWPDFYRRVYTVLFPEADRLNLSEVLQEAKRELPQVERMRRWLEEQDATRSEDSCE